MMKIRMMLVMGLSTALIGCMAQEAGRPSALPKVSSAAAVLVSPMSAPVPVSVSQESYQELPENRVKSASTSPVSTFSIDVDTGSYALVRRDLSLGVLPSKHAVRAEEMINYFSYAYEAPSADPFAVRYELSETPWNKDTVLLKIGIKGEEVAQAALPDKNLVFLLDVSGSMSSANKLPLLVSALKMLSKQLTAKDRVAIVVYAGDTGVVLESTPGNEVATIHRALSELSASGSTNGAAGIQLAYQIAQQNYIKAGINRILLATDGDLNVGETNIGTLKELVAKKRQQGISLTTLGFGQGNYNDHLMEQIADVGNGNYAYIDTLKEARKVLVEQMSGTFHTIAQDVKIQVEFNPDQVSEYRLIGYENRVLNREDFNNDKVDAGDIGAGHTVTALYELALKGSKGLAMDPLRYSNEASNRRPESHSDELLFVKMRYKQPGDSQSLLKSWAISKTDIVSAEKASKDFNFSAAVAAFAQKLSHSQYIQSYDYQDIVHLAKDNLGVDQYGFKAEFVQLIELADGLAEPKVVGL
jgi:Ca-activated chloride channel homolog